jgi:hypothetical protein
MLLREPTAKLSAMNRRRFLKSAAGLVAATALGNESSPPRFETRGVVLLASDLDLTDWPERAAEAGLNTIALHAPARLDPLVDYVRSPAGRKFLAACERLGIRVEYELHAMSDLLPRRLFQTAPEMFRVNQTGIRTSDFNCCPSSVGALEVIASKAVEYSRVLRPTTHRYFYWPDDGRAWCQCKRCAELTASEQALLVENAILRMLRQSDRKATLAHLAYQPTLQPPAKVKPGAGVFLEFAPIGRRHDQPFAAQTAPALADRLETLDSNLRVFARDSAQVLEYWLDVSRFSGWRRPAKKLPWYPDVLRADLDQYQARGIRHVTSFACYIDADYVQLHGQPWAVISAYGKALL